MRAPLRLSAIELGVLIELANGRQSKEIAEILGRSTATIELHVQRLRARFNAQSRAHLIACAFRAGVIAAHDIEDPSISSAQGMESSVTFAGARTLPSLGGAE